MTHLGQTLQHQQQVPDEDIKATHRQPAPHSQTEESGSQKTEDVQSPICCTTTHIAQKKNGVTQMVDGTFSAVGPSIADCVIVNYGVNKVSTIHVCASAVSNSTEYLIYKKGFIKYLDGKSSGL